MAWEDEFVLYSENFLLEKDHQKLSYERHDYESVDDNNRS